MDIHINNINCQVFGANENELNFLKDFLRVEIDGAIFSKKYKTKIYTCNSCKLKYKTTKNERFCKSCGDIDLDFVREWDGYYYFFRNFKFKTGFLPMVVTALDNLSIQFKLIDKRNIESNDVEIVYEWLDVNGGTVSIRDWMRPHISKFVGNKVNGLPFVRGIYKAATNSGKSYFLASFLKTFPNKKTLLIVHRQLLLNQLVEFFRSMGIDVSVYDAKTKKLGSFTIAMVRTLKNATNQLNVVEYLKSVEMLLIDECHKASSNEYLTILNYLDNTYIRLYVSGTPLSGSDANKMNVISGSGDVLAEVSNSFLIDKKNSLSLNVCWLNYNNSFDAGLRYDDALLDAQYNTDKLAKLKDLLINYQGAKVLILTEFLEHTDFLFDNLLDMGITVSKLTGKGKNRDFVLEQFKKGNTNIMISTLEIVAEGLNLPLINIGVNYFGGKSKRRILQTLGRILRVDGVNESALWVDFNDSGYNTKEHSDFRLNLYKEQGFNILENDFGNFKFK